jgi:eukaryotic-like serine/threonine-protein kinase
VGYRQAMTRPKAPDPSAGPDDVGRLIGGRYRLEAIVGRGGMATIYRARDERSDRLVAVKVLRPEIAADRDLAERFRREALAASVLSHPNIVACFDTGTDPAGPYLVMALVDGEDLSTRLRRESMLPPPDVARIGLDVARALGVAHERGIVHRDVKPGNILLATDGRALVTDFGIARLADDVEGSVPGTILGSVQYFSPEQARGDTTTTASDVYGLGLVLYEALTGLRPWSGETSAAIALARIGAPAPSPRASRAEVPVALDSVIVRALDPDPLRRFPDGNAFATALERLLVAPAPMSRPRGEGAAAPAVTHTPQTLVPPAFTRTPRTAGPVAPALVAAPPARRGLTAGPMLALLAFAGLLLGAVAVAAFPGIGSGTGALADGPTEPGATAVPPTPEPTEAPSTPPSDAPTAPPAAATPATAKTILADLCEPIFGIPCGQDPGRYRPSRFEPSLSFELGDGWSTEAQTVDRVALDRNEGRLTLLGDVTRIYPKGKEVAANGSLRKLIDRIASTRDTAASKIRGLTIDGHAGFSVDLTTEHGDGVPILGVGEDTFYLQPSATTRIVLLEAGKRALAVIIEPVGGASLPDILATADDVAGSLRLR